MQQLREHEAQHGGGRHPDGKAQLGLVFQDLRAERSPPGCDAAHNGVSGAKVTGANTAARPMPNRARAATSAGGGSSAEVKTARVVPLTALVAAGPTRSTTRRAMACAGSTQSTGHGASRTNRSSRSG